MSSARLLWTALAVMSSALMLLVPAAQAEQQPPILKSYGLDWIERVRDEAWPQPRAQRPIVCLLDTGVAVTADTPENNAEGPIVGRLNVEDPFMRAVGTLDADPGLPRGTTYDHLHGTRMASIIGAPRNGFGTVGVFPQARILSVRVTLGDQVYITPSSLVLGVNLCLKWAAISNVRVAGVVMAESLYDQRDVDASKWLRAAGLARDAGALFVAAVGNRPDARSVAPISVEGIVPVAAGDDSGSLCGFAQYEAGESLLGPGCSAFVWPEGSSSATAAVGALVAAILTRAPATPVTEVEGILRSLQKTSPAGLATVDGSGLMAQFEGLIESPPAPPSQAGLVVEPETSVADARVEPVVRLWRPAVRVTYRNGKLRLRRTDQGPAGRLSARYGTGSGIVTRASSKVARAVTFSVQSRPKRAEVWIESNGRKRWRSLSTKVRIAGTQ